MRDRLRIMIMGFGCVSMLVASPAFAAWELFTTRDGIIESPREIMEDSKGRLWISSFPRGVTVFDGTKGTIHLVPAPGSRFFPEPMVEDRDGVIWVANKGSNLRPGDPAFALWRNGAWDSLRFDMDVPVAGADCMFRDVEGSIWVGEGQIIGRFDGVDWDIFPESEHPSIGAVWAIHQARDGVMWFGGGNGIASYSDGEWHAYVAEGEPGNVSVNAMTQDRDGTLWFGGEGLFSFDGQAWDSFPEIGAVRGLAATESGNLWVAVYGRGLYRFDGVEWILIDQASGLPDDTLTGVLVDSRGAVLATSGAAGLIRYAGSWMGEVAAAEYGVEGIVIDLVERRPGEYWVAGRSGIGALRNGELELFDASSGLLGGEIRVLAATRRGDIWVGSDHGVSIHDGAVWTTRAMDRPILSILEHSSGDIWVGTGYGRIDAAENPAQLFVVRDDVWLPVDPGIVDPLLTRFTGFAEDAKGDLWVAAREFGVGRFDGEAFTWYTRDDGLPGRHESDFSYVGSTAVDGAGHVWVTEDNAGVARFDGERWESFDSGDGLPSNRARDVISASDGSVWFSTELGVARHHQGTWQAFDELGDPYPERVLTLMEDHSGRIWAGTGSGVRTHIPDRVAPRTLFLSAPPTETGERDQTFLLATAFKEDPTRIQYSYSLDGSGWSPWSSDPTIQLGALPDGPHEIVARSRDAMGNIDPFPPSVTVEVDATPPQPEISAPGGGEVVLGTVAVRGTTADARFAGYRLLLRPGGTEDWSGPEVTVLVASETPVSDGTLADWSTTSASDGPYDLRLEVNDRLGLIGADVASVVVDNEAPWAFQTAPARIEAAAGGEVYTVDGTVRLYFPPHAFARDATVSVEPVGEELLPDPVPGGPEILSPAYELTWEGMELAKRATLGLTSPKAGLNPAPRIHRLDDHGMWIPVGGTPQGNAARIASPVREPGTYVLAAGGDVASGLPGLTDLTLTPRVFSPSGGFASREVAIGFRIDRPGPVTVRVYARSGRLVRKVLDGGPLAQGANLVTWDGTDHAGSPVPDGLYLVHVTADGREALRTLSVVR